MDNSTLYHLKFSSSLIKYTSSNVFCTAKNTSFIHILWSFQQPCHFLFYVLCTTQMPPSKQHSTFEEQKIGRVADPPMLYYDIYEKYGAFIYVRTSTLNIPLIFWPVGTNSRCTMTREYKKIVSIFSIVLFFDQIFCHSILCDFSSGLYSQKPQPFLVMTLLRKSMPCSK